MKHFLHVDHFLHDFGLADIPRNTVEDERIDVWFKLVRLHRGVDRRSPELDRDLIGHELAFAGVLEEGLAYFRAGVDRAKYIAAGAMIKAWDCAKRFALRPFAAARRAKEDKGIVSHHRKSVYTAGGREPKSRIARLISTRDRIDIRSPPRPIEAHIAIDQRENRVIATKPNVS